MELDLTRIIAIICLTAICCTALMRGIDSALVSAISAVIGGIVGYTVGKAGGKGEGKEE
ncbi:MAG: hypothetical protein QXS32_09050 [Candidatus Nezhaarchaeales archaeon]